MKSALITGVTGQDGSYVAEHFLAFGYSVPTTDDDALAAAAGTAHAHY
jgi:GDP-D-mannose dehydratase